jgi:photosystem II stability/assembly factor-like uncharacterized protein
MNNGSERNRRVQTDQMIDQIVAWRSGAGSEPPAVTGVLAADQALIAELSRLEPADWPADEVGERITSTVLASRRRKAPEPAAAEADVIGSGRTRADGAGHWRRRWLRVAAPLAAAAAVIVVVAVLVIVNSSHGTRTGVTSPGGSVSPRRGPSPSVSQNGPFVYEGTGNLETNDFECVTASVCYAWFTGGAGNGPNLRTSDAGVAWRQVAGLPDGLVVTNQTEPSCPTAQVCFASTGSLALAVTTDGGSSWSLDRLPAPPGGSGDTVDQVSCATAQQCVVHLSSGQSGAFLYTTNGGQSWTAATGVPADAPATLYYLRCDAGGHCIGADPGSAGLQVISSADGGVTWTVSTATGLPSATTFLMSCGDGLNCVYVGDTGIAVTSDGGATWQQPAVPASWHGNIAAVSCAFGSNCFVAVNNQTVGGGSGPLFGTTSNLITWTTVPAPDVGGSLIAKIDSVSCVGSEACFALAETQAEAEPGVNSPSGVETLQRMVFFSAGLP